MPLRFFADHCIPTTTMQALRRTGHEVLRLKDHLPVDSLVISKAQELDSILLSLNGDFADIVAYPPGRFRGIVTLLIRDHPEIEPIVLRRLTAYLAAHHSLEYYVGKLVIVEPDRIRIRS